MASTRHASRVLSSYQVTTFVASSLNGERVKPAKHARVVGYLHELTGTALFLLEIGVFMVVMVMLPLCRVGNRSHRHIICSRTVLLAAPTAAGWAAR
jgi:hypothetical protein